MKNWRCTDKQQSLANRRHFQSVTYTPYGAVSANRSPTLAFCGQALDPITRSYPLGNGHRFYSPTLMRFISPDSLSPFGKGGISTYAYCKGDPINHVDPTGQYPAIITPIRSIVAGVVNLTISIVKVFRNYRMERNFAPSTGYPASRSGVVTYGTPEENISTWTIKDKVLSGVGVVSASVSIGTSIARLTPPTTEALMWVDFGMATVATTLSVYELYNMATSPIPQRYPIQPVAYQVRGGTPQGELRV
ncbi:RHS repeat-associated core domain-containing protein [Pseudomonas sp. S36]|uniref:RHS repeat-associated core domain-containing protein n=1 Tax=Pseudomonas sp. S36 TaxID=2767447 RepID=UPI002E2E69EC|nr:RHS repeat-associated core domain-containing protein [Pseudomonas sp. S36]MBK4990065.1 RHS repeat-associated core domain-containing protein [Pseudomonas sp. S36]